MLILKQNAANTVPTPPAGKGTIFLDDSDTLSVKTSDGNVETFPTVAASNSQVVFMNGTALSGEAALTYDFNNNVLNISGNVAAGNVKTDNLLYANGVPWDLSDPGGSNTQIQFNDDESFGGSAALTFNKSSNAVTMSGNLSAGNVSATLLTGTLTTAAAAQPNVTSVGTLSGLAVTANITAGNVYANSGVIGASVLTGPLSTAAQPNITSVGSLTSLTVTGNANVGNIGGNNGVFTTVSGTLSTASQPNITSVGTLSALGVNGNLTASNISANTGAFYGNGAGLTNIPGGNITGNITGNISNANFAAFAAEVTDASQPNITSVGTLVDLTVTGNVSAGNVNTAGKVVASSLESNVSTGTAPFVVASTTKVTNLNADLLDGFSTATAATGNTVVIRDADGSFSANIITATLSGAATTAGTVTTAAQPNITSVGSLTSLTVTGNASAGNISTGGVLSVTGNANVGNLGTGGLITATGNVSGGNLTTAGVVAATGNVSGGNLTTGGAVVATGNVSGGNLTTAGALSVTGNANVGNIGAAAGVFTTVAGTLTTAAQPNVTSVGTLTSLTVTGNVSAGNVSATTFTGALSGAATTAGTVTTAAQPNITSVGTLTSLGVNGTVTAVAFTANTGVFTGNGSGLSAIAGANVTGTVSSATTAGTVTTAAQPNITSVGTLSSLAVTGNGTFGNVYANSGTIGASLLTGTLTTAAQPNITSVGTLSSVTITGNVAAGNLTTTGILSVTGTGVSSIAGNLDMTSNNIINLASPTSANDAATKQYVDDLASTALVYHEGVTAATTGTLASATGGTITYNNGTAGVGATLTTTGTFNLIDTANVQTIGTRILVKDEANAAHNGVYTYTSTTVITRSTDADSYGPGADELSLNNYFFVSGGSVNKGSAYVVDSPTGTITFGTSNILFAQFSSSQIYAAGTGLTLTGTTFSVNASQTQITSVGTLTGLSVNGNITAANITANTGVFTGNGSGLSAIAGANVTGTVSSATTAGTVTTAAQPNITSTGTLTSLAVTGNISAGNVSATTFTGALSGAATTAGTVTTAAQPNITSVGTLTGLGVNGTVTAVAFTANTGVFTGNGSALTALNASNISTGTLAQARLANASVTLGSTALTLGSTVTTVAGLSSVTSTTFVGALTGAATTAGTVTTAAQPNITSVGTLTSLTVSGGITNANITTGANSTAGSMTGNWSLTAGSRLNATYADLAEKYVADADYEAGAVLVFGGVHEVTLSTDHDSHRVAGVVSTNPAYTMNNDCAGAHVATIALQGRVPVKVHGPVAKGDLMVSGPDGRAVANNMARAGTILGKALENFEGGSGVIEVAVGRF